MDVIKKSISDHFNASLVPQDLHVMEDQTVSLPLSFNCNFLICFQHCSETKTIDYTNGFDQ